jgi:hypothetical protein
MTPRRRTRHASRPLALDDSPSHRRNLDPKGDHVLTEQPRPDSDRSTGRLATGAAPEFTEAADADLAEQLRPAEPEPDDDGPLPPRPVPLEADPADVFEQQQTVPVEPEDYR